MYIGTQLHNFLPSTGAGAGSSGGACGGGAGGACGSGAIPKSLLSAARYIC